MFTFVATYRTAPEAARVVGDLLAQHAATSEREAGCRQFRAHRALDDPTRFFLYENYDSRQAFAAHRRTDHFRQNIEQTLAPLLIEREWHACTEPLRITREWGEAPGGLAVKPASAISCGLVWHRRDCGG